MKKRRMYTSRKWGGVLKICKMMRLVLYFVLLGTFVANAGVAQNAKVTLNIEQRSLLEIIQELRKNFDYRFLYRVSDLEKYEKRDLKVRDADVGEVMDQLLKGTRLGWRLEDDVILIRVVAIDSVSRSDQQKFLTLKGFVCDEKKQALPGVTIKLAGTSWGTATDAKGWFSVKLPVMKGTLEFSFIGYKNRVVEFIEKTAKDTLRVTLQEDVKALDETIVVAYGTTTRRETTGSISVVKADEIKGIPSPNLASLLQGRVAGLDITQMSGAPGGGGTAVVIRGYNSLEVGQKQGSFSSPLWVVDGVPMNAFTSPVTGINMLADINPEMIESVQVLKDASSAAMYGSRAANGVIIITTKKGRMNQKATLSANISQSWAILPKLPTITVGKLERDINLQVIRNTVSAYLDPETSFYVYPTTLEEVYYHPMGSMDANWQPFPTSTGNGSFYQDSLNAFYNNATNFFPMYYGTEEITNANIQTYGGTEYVSYGIGLGYYNEGGVLKGSGFNRIDLNTSLNVIPIKKFNIDLRMNASLTNRKRGSGLGNSMSTSGIDGVPGDPFELSSLLPGEGTAVWDEIVTKRKAIKEKNRSVRLRSSMKLGYDILKGLNFSATLASDYAVHRRNYFSPSYLNDDGYSISIGETAVDLMALTEELLSYKITFGDKHDVNAMVGFSYQYDQSEYNYGHAQNSPSDKIYYAPSGMPSLGVQNFNDYERTVAFQAYRSDMTEMSLVSFFARLEYNYQQKYLFSAAFRRDGSSTFGRDHKWGTFPSVAAGWTFTEEPFMKRFSDWLDFGKIRASWGRSGNHYDEPYLALGIMQAGEIFENNPTLQPQSMYNDDLSWEETDQYDFGLDVDCFNYRLGITLDYYYRYSDKKLMSVLLPALINGYNSQVCNEAALSNEGLELFLKYEILRRSDLYWKISVNAAKNWNRFEKAISKKDNIDWIIGKPLNGIYVYKTNGFVNRQEDVPIRWNTAGNGNYISGNNGYVTNFYHLGDLAIIDVNGDVIINEKDRVYAGSALPKLYGGIVNEFQWKNFDLNFSLAFQIGRHMINSMSINWLNGLGIRSLPILMKIKENTFWQQPGDNDAEYAKLSRNYGLVNYSPFVDRNLEKVSWLKFKTFTLGYILPKSWISKVGLEEVRCFVSGENLFTWTNYSGLDPETVNIQTGFDGGRNYPLARKFTLGLTLKF